MNSLLEEVIIKEHSPKKYKCVHCGKILPPDILEFCDDYCEAQFVSCIDTDARHQTILPNPPSQVSKVIRKLRENGCSNTRLFFQSPEGLKFQWRCKRWDCSICEPKNRRRIRAQILYAAYKDEWLRRFMTLTFDENNPKFIEAYRKLQEEENRQEAEWNEDHIRPYPRMDIQEFSFHYMAQAFRKFQIYLARAGYKPDYYKVNVRQPESGNCHYHLVLNLYIPQELISDCFERAGGGYISDIRWVERNQIASYLSKYFSDDHKDEFHIPRGVRHYSTSRYLLADFSIPQKGFKLMVYGEGDIPREANKKDMAFSSYSIMVEFKPPP